MKSVINLYKLKMRLVINGAVLVIPTVAVAAFLSVMYAIVPQQITSSFLMSGVMLFVISTYISMVVQAREDDVHEELLMLHSHSDSGYYISRELVIYSISLVYAIILIIYPLIRYMANKGFFTRSLEMEDVVFGSLFVIGNGICGVALGDFFHHRIINKRRNGIIALVFIVVLAFCKVAIIQKISFLNILNFLLPPVLDGYKMVGDTDIFEPKESTLIFIHSILFVLALIIIKIVLLRHRKFS